MRFLLLSYGGQPGCQVPARTGNQPIRQNPQSSGMDPIEPGYNRRARVVGGEVITARHRNIALLVAGCYFMEMLDGTNIIVS